MSKKEWKISGVFLGMIAFVVALMAVFMDENVLDRIERSGTTVEDLKERDGRKGFEAHPYRDKNVEDFRSEMESRGYTLRDGKIVRRP